MIDACEIIAWHLCTMAAQEWSGISELDRAAYRTTAAGMVEAITDSGFRILGPDEVGAVVEACEEAMPYVSRYESDNFSNAALDTVAKLDTAIGALKEKRT